MSTQLARRFLDPAVVSRLGTLDLKARMVVEGFISGLHRSPFHGFSVEFVEHRPYMPGDPLKSVDWKVLGKSDRFYVKQYEDETNLRAHLVPVAPDRLARDALDQRPERQRARVQLERARAGAGQDDQVLYQPIDPVALALDGSRDRPILRGDRRL